jgi:enoyl-CoA hydratase/carnithine racemase
MQLLLKGEAVNLARAKQLNLIHAVVPAADLIKAAKDWIKGGGTAVAPWDEKSFKLPGGPVFSKMGMQMFPAGNAIYRRETYDNYPAGTEQGGPPSGQRAGDQDQEARRDRRRLHGRWRRLRLGARWPRRDRARTR